MTVVTLIIRRLPVNAAGRVIGEAHHRARLSDAMVQLIYELGYADPSPPQARIAEAVGCSRSTVRDILNGRRRVEHVAGYKLVAVRVPNGSPT